MGYSLDEVNLAIIFSFEDLPAIQRGRAVRISWGVRYSDSRLSNVLKFQDLLKKWGHVAHARGNMNTELTEALNSLHGWKLGICDCFCKAGITFRIQVTGRCSCYDSVCQCWSRAWGDCWSLLSHWPQVWPHATCQQDDSQKLGLKLMGKNLSKRFIKLLFLDQSHLPGYWEETQSQ